MNRSPRQTPNRFRRAALALFLLIGIAAGVGVYQWAGNRDAPQVAFERLPRQYQLLAREGKICIVESRQNPQQTETELTGMIILTPSRNAKQERSQKLPGKLSPQNQGLRLINEALVSVAFRRTTPLPAYNGGGGGGGTLGGGGPAPRFHGFFRQPASLPPPLPGEKRIANPLSPVIAAGETYLWHIPLNGGTPTKTRLDTQGRILTTDYLLADDGLYWRREGKGTDYTVSTKSGYSILSPPSDSLMFSPADGGAAQVVETSLYSIDRFLPDAQTLCYLRRGAYPDTAVGLCVRRLAEGARREKYFLPDYDAAATYAPVAFGGRWYWVERERDGTEEMRSSPDAPDYYAYAGKRSRIVSDALNGGDRRIVVSGSDAEGGNRSCERLFVEGNRLYVLITKARPGAPNGAGSALRGFVARIRPDKAAALGTLRPLPDGAEIYDDPTTWSAHFAADSGFLYIAATRYEKDWRQIAFDVFSEKTIQGGETSRRLYRLPLPE